MEQTKHKHFELCYRAHRNTSHVPEKRAEAYCKSFDDDMQAVAEAGGDTNKLESLFVAWMHAHSRCASTMITGPAGFNTRRAEKANESERNHASRYYDYINGVKERYEKEQLYKENPEARPIKSDDADALPRLRAKLEAQEAEHARLKSVPARERSHSFELAYSLKAIKATRDRIAQIEKTTALPRVEVQKEGFKVIQNPEAMRVQIEFDGKPDGATRDRLKGLGFKWAPSAGVWQRNLNNAGIYAAKQFMAAQQ